MNTFKLGSLIRRSASQISSNRYSNVFTAILKPRFFSDDTNGESAVYHHARLFKKPLSAQFKSNLSNSVNLMGFVDQPIRVLDTGPDRFGVSTLLRVKDPRNPNQSFRISLSMWDVIARKCIAHLKPNDHILVSGRLVSYSKSSSNDNTGLDLDYQVKVTEVNYVAAPPSHVVGSQISQKSISETGNGREESKNDKIDSWEGFFTNPDDWWDDRRNKENLNQADFKHKDTGYRLWLNSDTPDWVTRQLELLDERKLEKSCYEKIHLWQDFFANPDNWWDKRRNKTKPKQPDFKHKDTGKALWLNSGTPDWVTRQLELFDERKPESGCSDEVNLWKDFFANPDDWRDKRRNKKNPKQPDFVNKDTDEALWLNSFTPDWVTRQLELPDQRKPEECCNDEIYLWQVFFANPDEWWDKRRNKTNLRQPDFKHKDTSEALWLNSDLPDWVTRQLGLLDQRRAEKISCYNEEHRRRSRLTDWI